MMIYDDILESVTLGICTLKYETLSWKKLWNVNPVLQILVTLAIFTLYFS